MKQERVLVGIGDDAGSRAALDWVIQRAARTSVQVVLLTALNGSVSDRAGDDYPLARIRDRIRSTMPEAGVEFVPTKQLLLESLIDRSASSDLLVVGASRRHRLLSPLVRSFPLRVAARAHCATVVVPVAWRPSAGPIIVGVGDDQSADRATLFAAREAADCDCDLIVVHCWSMPPAGDTVAPAFLSPDEWKTSHREILHNAVDRIRAAFPKARLRAMLEQSPSGPQFAARAEHSRLIVLGTHHRGQLAELLLGSTARDVLHTGAAPVAIVPLKRKLTANQAN